MKIKYCGETSPLELTKGRIYDVIAIEKGWYRIVDDSGEDYLAHISHHVFLAA